jgi:membrane protease YdiL (CAAX protease family)
VNTERAASRHRVTLGRVVASAAFELIIAAVLLYFTAQSVSSPFEGPAALATQASLGFTLGAALAGLQIVLLRRFSAWQAFSRQAIAGTKLGPAEIVCISVIVGVAEELLFRAAMQPLLGLWLTSLLFAAVHVNYGALRGARETRLLSALALSTVFAIGVCLGVVFERLGLVAAMVMHAVYDMIVLLAYRRLFGWADSSALTRTPRARALRRRDESKDPRR